MSDSPADAARRARAQARGAWPMRKIALGDEDDDGDLTASTTADERLAMMERLALDAWASSGAPWPSYTRANMPGRIVRRGDGRTGD